MKQSAGAATLLKVYVKPTTHEKNLMKNTPNPHAGKTRHGHKSQKDRPRLRTSHTQQARDQHPVDVRLAKCGGNRQAADKKHDRRREHDREYVSGKHSSMTCSDIDSMTYLVASDVDSGKGFSPSERTTLKTTKRNGTRVEVTKSGIA